MYIYIYICIRIYIYMYMIGCMDTYVLHRFGPGFSCGFSPAALPDTN